MSDLLALDWDRTRLAVVQGRASGNHVTIRKCALLEWPEEIDLAQTPDRASEWLQGELTARGFNAKQALVSLPREQAVMRHLELPATPPEELPEMVRLQAATKVTVGPDQYLLDFLPLPPRHDETTDVLMCTVPTEVTSRMQSVLSGAGVEVESIGISALDTCDVVTRLQDAQGRSANQLHLVVSLLGSRLEVALIRGQQILTTHGARLGPEDQGEELHRAVNAEVNRVRLSAETLHNGLPISHVWVAPTDPRADALCSFLQDKLHCAGDCFDPLNAVGKFNDPNLSDGDRASFAGPVGMLLTHERSLTPVIDFLNPRKPEAKRDLRGLRIGLAVVGVVALLVVGWMTFNSTLDAKDARARGLRKEVAEMNRDLKSGADVLAADGEINKWEFRHFNWLDGMEELTQIMPPTDQVLLSNIHFRSGGTRSRGTVHLEGYAATRDDAETLGDVLAMKDWSVVPEVTQSRRDENYSRAVIIDATIPLEADE